MKKLLLLPVLSMVILAAVSAQQSSFDTPNGLHFDWGKTIRITLPAPEAPYIFYTLQLFGPENYFLEKTPLQDGSFEWSREDMPVDGRYKMHFVPTFQLEKELALHLQLLRENNELEKIDSLRKAAGIIEMATLYYAEFQVLKGSPINPTMPEKEPVSIKLPSQNTRHPESLVASIEPIFESPDMLHDHFRHLNTIDAEAIPKLNDQVFMDDVIIQNSLCVGMDCINGEIFGFSTIRMNENNTRIEFLDSSAETFPSVDWQLIANSSEMGGLNYFRIYDQSNNKNIFTAEANAPEHSLYINSFGKIGLGSNNPGTFELFIEDGNTPTLSLNQNGTQGWTPQRWDIAGNETNFFIRDGTNSNKLIFRIRSGAKANSIYIAESSIGINNTIKVAGLLLPIADQRLQQDLCFVPDALSSILRMKPRSWHFDQIQKPTELMLPEGPQYGLVAQELEAILPDLVKDHELVTMPDGSELQLKGIHYDGVVTILVKGMQEQQALIDAQAEKIKELELNTNALTDLSNLVKQLSSDIEALKAQNKNESLLLSKITNH